MGIRNSSIILTLASALSLVPATSAQQSRASADGVSYAPIVLRQTEHPRVPRDLTQLWFVPRTFPASAGEITAALRLTGNGQYAQALPVLSQPASQQGVLGFYAIYDLALAERKLGQIDDARRLFRQIQERQPVGALMEEAAFGEAECDEALKDYATALVVYERMLQTKLGQPDEVLIHAGRAAKADGQSERAAAAFVRVYYEFALSEFAAEAGSELAVSRNVQPIAPGSERYKLALGRAERLFGAKQYGAARAAFTELRPNARGDDKDLVDLRIAEANYYTKNPRNARDGLRGFLTAGSRQGEALYFNALVARDLGDLTTYLKTVRRVADEFPKQNWAEEALNNLAQYYVVKDQDDLADQTFRELYAKFPKGIWAERAAWKVGWRAYQQEHYADTVSFFEHASADFPRSDYRPSWLYWSARAYDHLDQPDRAEARYGLVLADYVNTYYGHLTVKRHGGVRPPPRVFVDGGLPGPTGETDPNVPPNAEVIRALVTAGLYTEALNELRYAQRIWGDAPTIQATIAWISREQGLLEKGGWPRFNLVRGAITTMKRAYPQFLAAGGEQLPREILEIIFPLEYWELIRSNAEANNLDPYLVAALVNQESTFVADIRSSANAVGLMQLIAPTARQYARRLGLPYSTSLMSNPEANIRMGTTYLADLVRQFGSMHLALASYNAGETAVRRWMNEFQGMEVEEFIDSITYPETQGYVKRVLAMAEDYRALYGN